MVGEAATIVDPEDESKISEAIVSLIDNQSLRSQLASKGRIQAEAFSWSKTASETQAVYEQVLSNS